MRTRDVGPKDPASAAALALARQEGWRFEPAEFDRLLSLGRAVVLEDDTGVHGMLTMTEYPGVTWIGNVVVSADRRGEGLGERLMRGAIAGAKARGGTLALYSVKRAVSLYARLGFQGIGEVHALGGQIPAVEAPSVDGLRGMRRGDLAAVAAFDRRHVGFDRTLLLSTFFEANPRAAWVLHRNDQVAGFALARPSRTGAEIGPVVADTEETQAALFDAALASVTPGLVDFAVPGANLAARDHAAAHGFGPAYDADIMVLGPSPPTHWTSVFAVGGLEMG